jgi:hypothetical protein
MCLSTIEPYSRLDAKNSGSKVYVKFECIDQRRSAWCRTAELSEQSDSETPRRLPHATYVLHRTGCAKRTISYCVKDGSGAIHAEGTLPATRWELDRWMKTLPPAVDRGDGSHWVDLRSLAAACRCAESSASVDAAGHCSGENEE